MKRYFMGTPKWGFRVTTSPILKHCFPPVVDVRVRLLVLGSLPGEESLARGCYYAHPRNQFWRLIGPAIGRDLAGFAYEERLKALLEAHVGLWDVVASAARSGSLDAAIRNPNANDLAAFVATLPDLRAVAFNGGTSARIGREALAGVQGIALVPLPSSSPAYTLAFDRKREAWEELRRFL